MDESIVQGWLHMRALAVANGAWALLISPSALSPPRAHGQPVCAPAHVHRHGVLIGNFVEDAAGLEFQATGKHTLGFGEPFKGNTIQRM